MVGLRDRKENECECVILMKRRIHDTGSGFEEHCVCVCVCVSFSKDVLIRPVSFPKLSHPLQIDRDVCSNK